MSQTVEKSSLQLGLDAFALTLLDNRILIYQAVQTVSMKINVVKFLVQKYSKVQSKIEGATFVLPVRQCYQVTPCDKNPLHAISSAKHLNLLFVQLGKLN